MANKISRELLVMYLYDSMNKRDFAEHMFDNMTDEQKLETEKEYNDLYEDDEGPTPWELASTE